MPKKKSSSKTSPDPAKLVRREEAAARLGVSQRLVEDLSRSGELQTVKKLPTRGYPVLVNLDEVREVLESRGFVLDEDDDENE